MRNKLILILGFLTSAVVAQDLPKFATVNKLDNTSLIQRRVQMRLGYKVESISDANAWIRAQLSPRTYQTNMSFLTIENKTIQDFAQDYKRFVELRKDNKDNKDEMKEIIKSSGLQTPAQILEEMLRRRIIYANESPNQLMEKMNYFWFNHFNVAYQKGPVRVFTPDYDKEIRLHSMGNFRDLLKTSLMHPAMLIYLDNARSSVAKENGEKKGGINENYARELLELHTMGVDSGYTQKDIQELAKILTGFTVLPVEKKFERLPEGFIVEKGFLFNPRMHDFSDKVFLGKTIKGSGFDEINQVLDLLVNNSKTAQFISKKLATYFVSDNPSPELIAAMSKSFLQSHGFIPDVLKTMIYNNEFVYAVTHKNKFKDPYNYVITSFNFCSHCDYANMDLLPVLGVMNQLGEPFMSHQTPDGYSMKESDWLSSTQMQGRFDAAKVLNRVILKNTQDFDGLKNNYQILKEEFSSNSLEIIGKKDNKEKLEFLLVTPEWMYY